MDKLHFTTCLNGLCLDCLPDTSHHPKSIIMQKLLKRKHAINEQKDVCLRVILCLLNLSMVPSVTVLDSTQLNSYKLGSNESLFGDVQGGNPTEETQRSFF